MNSSNYLISGANGDIAISMANIIRERYPESKVVGTDISSQWPALSFFDEVKIIPKAVDPGYLDSIRELLTETSAAYFIPTSEPELRWLAKNPESWSDLPLLMNAPAIILNCMDKLQSIRWLESLGLTTPKTSHLADARVDELPLLVKPRFGAGSRGIEIVKSAERLEQVQASRTDEAVAQEFLDVEDHEYTCALLSLPDGYRSFIMHRRMKGDVTGEMMGVQNPAIEETLSIIAAAVPAHTAINVQLRLTPSGPRVFEINPRFSSTVRMRHLLGFSDFQWLLESLEGQPVGACSPEYGRKVFRVYSEVVAS